MVISGFRGTSYPDDLSGQQSLIRPLVEPLVAKVLGLVVLFELYPRRGTLRGGVLPPCEVDFKDSGVATRFRTEAACLSRAKQEGMLQLYFNPCITLATR